MLFTDHFTQPIRSLYRSIHTQIRKVQAFLQLIGKIIIQLTEAGEHPAKGIAQSVTGLGKTGFNFIKKPHSNSLFHDTQILFHLVEVQPQQLGNALLLHGDTVEHVGSFHSASSVGNDDKLGLTA